jgi:hypothetical protein
MFRVRIPKVLECATAVALWNACPREESGAGAPHSTRLCRAAATVSVLRLGLVVLVLAGGSLGISAVEAWQQTLAGMPLGAAPTELNRTNCVQTILSAYQSNNLVKALVFMPGATDEFYLFRRAKATLTNSHPTMLDAITALTNQTFIHATFRAPFLLLHTDEDPLEPANTIVDRTTAERLATKVKVDLLKCNDWDWDALEPVLKHALKLALRPWRYSTDSWHFYRHSFVACNLNGLEALELATLAGKSKFTLRRREAVFVVDPRVQAAPRFDAHLR